MVNRATRRVPVDPEMRDLLTRLPTLDDVEQAVTGDALPPAKRLRLLTETVRERPHARSDAALDDLVAEVARRARRSGAHADVHGGRRRRPARHGAPRAVVDAHLLVQGLLRRRPSAAVRVYLAMLDRRFECVLSPRLLGLIRAILGAHEIMPLRLLLRREAGAFVSLLAGLAIVPPGAPARRGRGAALVDAAVEGSASYIVTDRRDLLALRHISVAGFGPVRMISPWLFLPLL
jgi:hypothetical protein